MHLLLAVALALLAATPWPAAGHHSFSAEFDVTKKFTFTGTVTKVEWANPHVFFYLDVKDEKTGAVTNWAMEMGSPNGLMRAGWSRATIKSGDRVMVEGSLARDGSPLGNAAVVILASTGQRLFTAQGNQ
jgi:hypothetical protein